MPTLRIGAIALLAVAALLFASSLTANVLRGPASANPASPQSAPPEPKQLVLLVDGLFPGGQPCGYCINAILGAVQAAPGVLQSSFTFQGHIVLTYDPAATDPAAILALPVFGTFPARVVGDPGT